jgi:hypothetical protein
MRVDYRSEMQSSVVSWSLYSATAKVNVVVRIQGDAHCNQFGALALRIADAPADRIMFELSYRTTPCHFNYRNSSRVAKAENPDGVQSWPGIDRNAGPACSGNRCRHGPESASALTGRLSAQRGVNQEATLLGDPVQRGCARSAAAAAGAGFCGDGTSLGGVTVPLPPVVSPHQFLDTKTKLGHVQRTLCGGVTPVAVGDHKTSFVEFGRGCRIHRAMGKGYCARDVLRC